MGDNWFEFLLTVLLLSMFFVALGYAMAGGCG